MLKKIFIILILVGTGTGLRAQTDSLPADNKLRIVPLPVIYYTPETNFGFGALASLNFRIGEPALTRKSNVQVYGLYTLNKQFDSSLDWNLFTNREKYVIKGKLAYKIFPQYYYGIGNDLREENKENLSYGLFRFEARLQKRLGKWFFGPQIRSVLMNRAEPEPGGILEREQSVGYRGYFANGAGLALLYDSRDNILNPSAGAYFSASQLTYSGFLGSDQAFTVINLDARKYFPVFKKHILAVQAYGNFSFGEVPFNEMSALGNSNVMRGYYNGRYRGNHHWALQSEYRLPLFWRIGMAGWLGVGDVSDKDNQLVFNNLKLSAGLGLRFMIDTKDRLNIRADLGFGKDGSSGFYLDVTEAF